MGIPAGIKSPSGDGDGEEVLSMSLHGDGDGDGENLPPRRRGWGGTPDGEFPVDISSLVVAKVYTGVCGNVDL